MAAKRAFKKRVCFYSAAGLICIVLLSVIIFPPDGSSARKRQWSVDVNLNNPWRIRKVQVPDGLEKPVQITFLMIGPVTISYLSRDSKTYFTQ
jgi:hypothetical protein